MPRIPDNFLHCVIYMYPSEEAAKKGVAAGGTGFLISLPSLKHQGGRYTYAVTNSHVIAEAKSPVIRLNALDTTAVTLPLQTRNWLHHPDGDDVAVALLPAFSPSEVQFAIVPVEQFLTKETVARWDIGPGDETFMVGRFVAHDGRQRNTPSARFGNISMMPWDPVPHPRGIKQESFLVETRSLGGYSGSPVFVHIPPATHRPNLNPTIGPMQGPWLLGIDWGHLPTFETVRESDEKTVVPQKWKVPSNSGQMAVVPAWRLRDLLYSQRLVDERAKMDEYVDQLIAAGEAGEIPTGDFATSLWEGPMPEPTSIISDPRINTLFEARDGFLARRSSTDVLATDGSKRRITGPGREAYDVEEVTFRGEGVEMRALRMTDVARPWRTFVTPVYPPSWRSTPADALDYGMRRGIIIREGAPT